MTGYKEDLTLDELRGLKYPTRQEMRLRIAKLENLVKSLDKESPICPNCKSTDVEGELYCLSCERQYWSKNNKEKFE